MSVGVLFVGKYRQCHARSHLRQDTFHPVPSLTGISSQCCEEGHKLELHSAVVWINSLYSMSRAVYITGQGREDRVGGCCSLECSQHHILHKPPSKETSQQVSLGQNPARSWFTLPLKTNGLPTKRGLGVFLFSFPFFFFFHKPLHKLYVCMNILLFLKHAKCS